MKINFSSTIFFLATFILFPIGCKEESPENLSFEIIDIEKSVDKFDVFSLSQFNAAIDYIPLESKKDFEISRITQIDFDTNYFIVSNVDLCILYDYNGSIIRKIGEKGRGPFEYNYILNSNFGFNNNIYLQSSNKFLEFTANGTFTGSFDLNKMKDPHFYLNSWTPINDSLFLGILPLLSSGHEENKAIIFNKKGEMKYRFKNYLYFNSKGEYFSSEDGHASFYSYGKKIHFKEMINDTLFYLTDTYNLIPIKSFKIGKYAKPMEYYRDIKYSNPMDYIFLNNLFELSNWLLLDCSFGKYTPAKRVTPRVLINGQQTWYNTTNVLGVYDKSQKTLAFCKPTTTDNPLFTTGFYNDIDAGPRFYPLKQVNDSTLVMLIDAIQLKDHVASDDFKESIPKYPEKKKALEELANSLTIYDNPVLMVVTFN